MCCPSIENIVVFDFKRSHQQNLILAVSCKVDFFIDIHNSRLAVETVEF